MRSMRDSKIVCWTTRDLSLSPFGNEEREVRRPSLVLVIVCNCVYIRRINSVDPLMALARVNGYGQ